MTATQPTDLTGRQAAARPLKGRMTIDYTVWCHDCWTWWQTAAARNKSDAVRLAKEVGWAYTRAFGWLCPECERK